MTEKKNGITTMLEALDESGKLEEIQQAIREQRLEKDMRRLKMGCR